MPTLKRHWVKKYPGVYWIETSRPTGKKIKTFYIMYRKDRRLVEEKAGSHGMTAAKASRIRAQRIENRLPTNREKRKQTQAQKEAEASRWTFDRLWEQYKKSHPGLRGIATDENRYSLHIKPEFGNLKPEELNRIDVDRLRVRLLKTRKPATVRNVLELLRRIASFGEKSQFCDCLGFTILMPRVDNQKIEDLTPGQMDSLLKALDESPNIVVANLMRLTLLTGMRRGELFRLRWKDIDFQRSFIHIREPKGGQSQNIPLNNEARALLQKHPKTSEYVFPGRNGRQRKDINHEVGKIKKAAGLPDGFRALHGLRHVYASLLASSGKVDMYTLQKLLTHKSPAMTQRYAHLRDDALRQASELAGELIQKQASAGSECRINKNE